MKDRKRRFETFSFYDRTGIEAHLKKMAEKGWMISEMTTLGWIYKRVEPESLTFAVSYYPKASEFDPEPTEGQNIYHDLSSRTGWQFVCILGSTVPSPTITANGGSPVTPMAAMRYS